MLGALKELTEGITALTGYYASLAEAEDREWHSLAISVSLLGRELDLLKARHESTVRATKGRFNVFTVLRRIGDETCLHSKWIAFLLDPKAEHDCGSLFLDLFVEVLQEGVAPHSDDADSDMLPQLDGFECGQANVDGP